MILPEQQEKDHQKKFHIFQKNSDWRMMCVNISRKSSSFSAIFDSSDPYEDYPCIKACIKKPFSYNLKPVCQCTICKNDDRTCNYCLNDK